MYSSSFLLAFLYTLLLHLTANAADPTDGFTSLPLALSNFEIQRPYNKPISQRHSFINGTHKLWVYSSDKPYSPTSNTMPRTEVRIRGYDYSSGVWQFEGYGYVPSGTTGVSIMQVFGATRGITSLMMKVYGGSLNYYSKTLVEADICNRWFRLNVIHDVEASKLQVYIDGILKMEVDGRGRATHFFKFGVYAQTSDSYYMESQWRGIKVLKKM